MSVSYSIWQNATVAQSAESATCREPRAAGAPAGHASDWLGALRSAFLGLQCKSTVLVVGLLSVVTAVLCGLTIELAWRLSARLEAKAALQEAKIVAKFAAGYVGRGASAGMLEGLAELTTGDPLWFVYVTDAEGHVLASADRTGGAVRPGMDARIPLTRLTGQPVVERMPNGGRVLVDVTYPIVVPCRDGDDGAAGTSAVAGYVRLGMNPERTIAEFDASADLVIGIGIAVVLASIPVGFMVVRRIVEPLNEMSEVAHRFSAGDLTARTQVRRSDEIGLLSSSLNEMADEIARKQGEVTALNSVLEQRVIERTEQLRELASRDPLTGLYNRRHFGEVLARRFAESRRYGNDLSVMMIDLDDFKSANDTFGHQTGDEVLVQAALTISRQLRSADVAARFGGDEFVVLLPQSDASQARQLATRITDRFAEELALRLPDMAGVVSLSIGVAGLVETDAATDEALLRTADDALYQAKAMGKNRVALAGTALQ
ncbi:MAG: diguanylate cyclase [Phycisphaerales bacterium]|nr:diguanylate cyclase [Phycisphaerales bacterium]